MGGKFSLALSQVSSVLQRRCFSASAVLVLVVGSTDRGAELACETSTEQENQLEPQSLSSSVRERPSPPPDRHSPQLGQRGTAGNSKICGFTSACFQIVLFNSPWLVFTDKCSSQRTDRYLRHLQQRSPTLIRLFS